MVRLTSFSTSFLYSITSLHFSTISIEATIGLLMLKYLKQCSRALLLKKTLTPIRTNERDNKKVASYASITIWAAHGEQSDLNPKSQLLYCCLKKLKIHTLCTKQQQQHPTQTASNRKTATAPNWNWRTSPAPENQNTHNALF